MHNVKKAVALALFFLATPGQPHRQRTAVARSNNYLCKSGIGQRHRMP